MYSHIRGCILVLFNMIAILKYELLKLLSRKTYIASTFVLVILALLLSFLTVDSSASIKERSNYLQYSNINGENNLEKEIEILNKEVSHYQNLQKYELNLRMPVEQANQEIVSDPLLQQYYEEFKMTGKELSTEIDNRLIAKNYLDQINNYPSYIQNIQQNSTSKHMKTAYADLQGISLPSINYLSVNAYVDQTAVSIISIIFMIVTVFFVFDYEREANMKDYLLLSKNGNKKTYFLKFLVCVIAISLFLIFTSLITVLLYNSLCAFPNLQAPIQAVPSLYESPYILTIGQWLVVDMVLKVIMLIGIMCLFIGCYTFIRNNRLSITMIFGLYIISFFLYTYINPYMSTNFLKYINIYAWLQTSQLISSYITFSFFNITVTNVMIFLIVIVVMLILGSVAILSLSKNIINVKTWNIKISLSNGKHTSHFLHELHKALLINRGIVIIILLCMGFGYQMYQTQRKAPLLDRELIDIYDTYGGKLSNNKIHDIEEQKNVYDQKEREFINIQKNYKDTGGNSAEYYFALEEYSDSLENKLAFASFYNEYKNRVDDYVVYNKGYNGLFSINTNEHEVTYSIIAIVAIILLLAPSYTIDQKNEENILYNLTKNGGRKRNWYKQVVGLILIGIVYLVIFGSDFLNFNAMYPIKDWQAPMTSILRVDSNFIMAPFLNENLSLGTYYLLMQGIRIIGMLTIGYLVLLISKYSKHSLIVVVISLSLVFVPAIIYFFGFHFLSLITVFDIVGSTIFLQSGEKIIRIGVIIGILLISFILINRKSNNTH